MIRAALTAAAAAFVATGALADEARMEQALAEGCLAIGGDARQVAEVMREAFYWSYRQAPSAQDFIMIRDDTQIFLDAKGPPACSVADLRATATPALVEAALEAKFPGAWTVAGDAPLTVTLNNNGGIAVRTGS